MKICPTISDMESKALQFSWEDKKSKVTAFIKHMITDIRLKQKAFK